MRNREHTTIYFFDMEITASASRIGGKQYQGLRPPSAADVVRWLEAVMTANFSIKESGDKRRATYLQKVIHERKVACLLISVSDKNAADPAFSDPAAKTRRVIAKKLEEGLEVSTHIVINLNPVKPNTYSLVLEGAAGLPSTRVEQFINFNLRKAASLFPDEFLVDHPTGAKLNGVVQKIKTRIKVSLKGHPSARLVQDINEGTLTALELIREKTTPVLWDQHGYVAEKQAMVALNVSGVPKRNPLVKHFTTIREVCDNASKKKFDSLRVRFKTPAGLNRTVLLDPST
jgi:hypothetical protein